LPQKYDATSVNHLEALLLFIFPLHSCVYSPTFSPNIFIAAVLVAHSAPGEISV